MLLMNGVVPCLGEDPWDKVQAAAALSVTLSVNTRSQVVLSPPTR